MMLYHDALNYVLQQRQGLYFIFIEHKIFSYSVNYQVNNKFEWLAINPRFKNVPIACYCCVYHTYHYVNTDLITEYKIQTTSSVYFEHMIVSTLKVNDLSFKRKKNGKSHIIFMKYIMVLRKYLIYFVGIISYRTIFI